MERRTDISTGDKSFEGVLKANIGMQEALMRADRVAAISTHEERFLDSQRDPDRIARTALFGMTRARLLIANRR
jgi:hypothetical protein